MNERIGLLVAASMAVALLANGGTALAASEGEPSLEGCTIVPSPTNPTVPTQVQA
jgi:ABC-type sugar transport system substrate-binding protein